MHKFSCQCALMEGHFVVTCRITLNHPSTAAMRLMSNYFGHLLSLDTPTYTVAQHTDLANGHSTETALVKVINDVTTAACHLIFRLHLTLLI